MRRLTVTILVLALGCTSAKDSPPTSTTTTTSPASPAARDADESPRAWLEDAAADAFAHVLVSVGLDAEAVGPQVSVGAHTIVFAVEIEHAGVHEGQHVLAAAFAFELDGRPVPALTTGAIGIGVDEGAARETAAAEWLGQYGAPIAFALAAREFPSERREPSADDGAANFYIPIQIDGREAFMSPVGLRGGAPEAELLSSDSFTLSLAAGLGSLIPQGPGYHGLTVQVAVHGSEVTDAGCRIDGRESPELSEVMVARTWPPGDYMYKQFFVLAGP